MKTLLQQGITEPEFYRDLVYRFRGAVGGSGFSEQFGELVGRCRVIGCGQDIMRRTACLVVGPVVVGGCASFFGCATAVRASGSVAASSWNLSQWVGLGGVSLA